MELKGPWGKEHAGEVAEVLMGSPDC
jgi:hypothetical protein